MIKASSAIVVPIFDVNLFVWFVYIYPCPNASFYDVTVTSLDLYCKIGPDRAQTFLRFEEKIENQLRPFIWFNESAPD